MHLLILLAGFLTSAAASADDLISIQVQDISIDRGEVPLEEVARLVESGAIADPEPLSAVVLPSGDFETDLMEPFEYVAEFDGDGSPLRRVKKPLGRKVTGSVKRDKELVTIELTYTSTAKTDEVDYSLESGAKVSQPVFSTVRNSTGFLAKPGSWTILPLSSPPGIEHRRYLAVRVIAAK